MKKSDWNVFRENGLLVLDLPTRRLGVFANRSGQVVLVTKDDGESVFCLNLDEVGPVIAALQSSLKHALEIDAELTAEYVAFEAISNAMKGSENA